MESGQYVGEFREKKLNGMGPISFGGLAADFATTYETHYIGGFGFCLWQLARRRRHVYQDSKRS